MTCYYNEHLKVKRFIRLVTINLMGGGSPPLFPGPFKIKGPILPPPTFPFFGSQDARLDESF
jgi:hypothetical protein